MPAQSHQGAGEQQQWQLVVLVNTAGAHRGQGAEQNPQQSADRRASVWAAPAQPDAAEQEGHPGDGQQPQRHAQAQVEPVAWIQQQAEAAAIAAATPEPEAEAAGQAKLVSMGVPGRDGSEAGADVQPEAG